MPYDDWKSRDPHAEELSSWDERPRRGEDHFETEIDARGDRADEIAAEASSHGLQASVGPDTVYIEGPYDRMLTFMVTVMGMSADQVPKAVTPVVTESRSEYDWDRYLGRRQGVMDYKAYEEWLEDVDVELQKHGLGGYGQQELMDSQYWMSSFKSALTPREAVSDWMMDFEGPMEDLEGPVKEEMSKDVDSESVNELVRIPSNRGETRDATAARVQRQRQRRDTGKPGSVSGHNYANTASHSGAEKTAKRLGGVDPEATKRRSSPSGRGRAGMRLTTPGDESNGIDEADLDDTIEMRDEEHADPSGREWSSGLDEAHGKDKEKCPYCAHEFSPDPGDRVVPGRVECPACGGDFDASCTGHDDEACDANQMDVCEECQGVGYILDDMGKISGVCEYCDGLGHVDRDVDVELPPPQTQVTAIESANQFDKFMDVTIMKEHSLRKVEVEDTPQRKYAKKYREHAINRMKVGGKQ